MYCGGDCKDGVSSRFRHSPRTRKDMSDIDLVIFDCDGVLVDSEVICARVEAELITAAGHAIEADEIMRLYAGLTFKDMLLRIERETGHVFSAALIDEAEPLIDARLAAEVTAIEGVHEAVESVTKPRCICSNSTSHRLQSMLSRTGILPLFEGRIFSGRDPAIARPKPAPDIFVHAARVMKAEPRHCMVIEDSVHGIAGARAAGMRVVGFTGASHSYPGHADLLMEAGAETVIRRWADLPGVVSALAMWSEEA
jgi:HAD superfamily hydrolase (TIGR01509 family)